MAELKKERMITLNGRVEVEGKSVVSLSANVTSDETRSSTYSEVVTDTVLYYNNREEVRAKIAEFKKDMYAAEDDLIQSEEIDLEPEEPKEPEE